MHQVLIGGADMANTKVVKSKVWIGGAVGNISREIHEFYSRMDLESELRQYPFPSSNHFSTSWA